MTEFPSQSHKSREPKVIQQVTTSEARIRKAPIGRRIRENFIRTPASSVWQGMIWDVFIPGLVDNIGSALHDGIDSMFGGTRMGRRTGSNRYAHSSASGISRYNPDNALGHRRHEQFDEDARRNQDISVIEIDSRVEAEEVLNQMNFLIDQFDVCTLADFYQLVGISPNHPDYKFGWENLGNARVVHSRGAYYLDLPKPLQLK